MPRRRGLGRGLEALIPEAADQGTDSPYREVDIADIVPNPYQPRAHFDEDALGSLASSISEVGVVQPILVRSLGDERYEIIAGERRWRAAQRAGLRSIPALVRQAADQDTLEAAVVENVQRQDLNALEEAAAYRQLMDEFGLNQAQVASRVGRSRSAVANTVRLLSLAPELQRLMAEGQLSAGHGRALLAVDDEAVRLALAEEIISENLTVREAERRAAESQADVEAAATTPEPDHPVIDNEMQAGLLELEELLSARLDTRVAVQLGKKRGKITIQFSGLADLERIYHLISEPAS